MSLELLGDGVIVSIIGMGMVFAFLVIVVWAMDLMAIVMRYLNRKFPEAVPEVVTSRKSANDDNNALALAIPAVMNYKNKK